MTTSEAVALLRDKTNSYTSGPTDPKVRAKYGGRREWRRAWGEAKATLAREDPRALAAIGRFPAGAGEPSKAHRRDPRSKRRRSPPPA